VEIRRQDYREVRDQFDRVVSVGMIEHVGFKNYRRYMQVVAESLGKDGRFLCQGIFNNRSTIELDPWIRRHIFPNSVLPSLARLTKAAEGLFLVDDLAHIGLHYDRTLCEWEANFHRAWPRFAPSLNERFRRMWRFCLLSCAGAFRARSMQVFQILFSRELSPADDRRAARSMPTESSSENGLTN
jgi:cyclopropane-fatty-acyl-phospholipid synthase